MTNTIYDGVANSSIAQRSPVSGRLFMNVYTKHRPGEDEDMAFSDSRANQVHKTKTNTRTDISPLMYG